MKQARKDAQEALKRLYAKLRTWSAVGAYIAQKSGRGSAKSWMVITNAVANGTRTPSHSLLVALEIVKPRRRWSCDIPDWMDDEEEEEFRAFMREFKQTAETAVAQSAP